MENAQLVAFDEQLDTIGESSLGGVVRGSFSAHPHTVCARRATYNFGMEYGRRTRRFPVDPFFQIHLAGGFEEADAVVVDAMIYPDASALERNVSEVDRPPEAGVLTRIRIPQGTERIEKERIAEQTMEFCSTDPRFLGEPYQQVFGATVDATRFGVVRVDVEAGKEDCYWLPDGEFAGEPTFVPRPGGDPGEGHVLTLVYDSEAHLSHLAIFDSRSLESGPIGRAHFDHHIPAGFHGIWVPRGSSSSSGY